MSYLRISVLVTLFFLPSFATLAQEGWLLTGTVWEKGTRTAINGADVFILEDENIYTQTDKQGRFTLFIEQAGDYKISAVAQGFSQARPASISLDESKREIVVELYLLPNLVLPEEIVIGQRNPDRVSKTVISGKELEQVAGSNGDPLRAIQSLPGVTVAHDGSAAPAIRGSRPGDNSYVADDLLVGYLFHSGGFASVFHADLVNDFNIHGAAFGPEHLDVIGAVLDVSLRDPRTDRFGSKWNIGLIGSDMLLEGPVSEDQSFYLAARRSYFDLVINEVSDDKEGYTIQIPRYWDYQGKYVWKLAPNQTLRAHANGARDTFAFSIAEDSEIADEEPDLVGNSNFSMEFHQQALSLESRLNAGGRNKLILAHLETGRDFKLGSAGQADVIQNNYYLRERYWFPLGSNHDVLLGTDLFRISVDIDLAFRNARCTEFDPECDLSSAERASLRDKFWINGAFVYAKDRWRFAEGWTLVPGVRLSSDNYLDDDYLEPRLGLEWDFSAKTLLTLGWGKHHQYPEGGTIIKEFGNPELEQLKSEHVVAGITQKLEQGWTWKLETYYKDYQDYVTADPAVNYTNGASGWSYGAELLVKKKQTRNFYGWLALTYSRSLRRVEQTGQTFAFDYDQPWIAVSALTYKFTPKLSLSLKWNYHTGTPYTPIYGSNGTYADGRARPNHGRLNSERLPNYHRLDLRLDYDHPYNTWKLNTYFELINAYNRKNVAGYDYNEDFTEREPVYQLPLIPSFGVQAEF